MTASLGASFLSAMGQWDSSFKMVEEVVQTLKKMKGVHYSQNLTEKTLKDVHFS